MIVSKYTLFNLRVSPHTAQPICALTDGELGSVSKRFIDLKTMSGEENIVDDLSQTSAATGKIMCGVM